MKLRFDEKGRLRHQLVWFTDSGEIYTCFDKTAYCQYHRYKNILGGTVEIILIPGIGNLSSWGSRNILATSDIPEEILQEFRQKIETFPV